MVAQAKKKIHFPKTRLAELAARAGGLTRDDAVDAALSSIEHMRSDADAEIRASIAAMEDIVFSRRAGEMLDADQMKSVLKHADQIVTLAGTFCYPALDVAAKSLCDVADGLLRSEIYRREPVAVHVQTMHLLAPGVMSLSQEHAETMLGELAKVANHFNFGTLSAMPGRDDFIAAATAKAS
ncbi:MAG TPA: hypothetical protein VG387_08570 [Rhizomicrobium sp.]|jgi:hypothetical protein|nr:hypothetical protein [Rhizomicrobium sp.]